MLKTLGSRLSSCPCYKCVYHVCEFSHHCTRISNTSQCVSCRKPLAPQVTSVQHQKLAPCVCGGSSSQSFSDTVTWKWHYLTIFRHQAFLSEEETCQLETKKDGQRARCLWTLLSSSDFKAKCAREIWLKVLSKTWQNDKGLGSRSWKGWWGVGDGRFFTVLSHRLHKNALQNERESRKMWPNSGQKVGDAGVDVWQVTCDPQWCWWSWAGRYTCLGCTTSALKPTVTQNYPNLPATCINSKGCKFRAVTIPSPDSYGIQDM